MIKCQTPSFRTSNLWIYSHEKCLWRNFFLHLIAIKFNPTVFCHWIDSSMVSFVFFRKDFYLSFVEWLTGWICIFESSSGFENNYALMPISLFDHANVRYGLKSVKLLFIVHSTWIGAYKPYFTISSLYREQGRNWEIRKLKETEKERVSVPSDKVLCELLVFQHCFYITRIWYSVLLEWLGRIYGLRFGNFVPKQNTLGIDSTNRIIDANLICLPQTNFKRMFAILQCGTL